MQGQQSQGRLYYRCRFPGEYALANKIVHPRNVYLAELDLLPPLDGWLVQVFAPHRLEETIAAMQAAQPEIGPPPGVPDAAQVIAECDAKLARYRQALEAGTDPKLVAQWTAEVQARRAEALSQTRQLTGQRRMTKEEIRAMIKPLDPLRDVLADADPQDKAEVYQNLGLKLTYEPGKQLVRAEATLDPHTLGIWSVSEVRHDQYANALAQRTRLVAG